MPSYGLEEEIKLDFLISFSKICLSSLLGTKPRQNASPRILQRIEKEVEGDPYLSRERFLRSVDNE